MKTKALVITASVGGGIQIAGTLITTVLSWWFYTFAVDLGRSADPSQFQGIGVLGAVIAGFSLLLSPALYIGMGILYTFLHHREEPPVTADQAALGGAVAAFVARFTSGIVGAALTIIGTAFMSRQLAATVPPGQELPFLGISMLSTGIGSMFGICIGGLVGASVAAIAGAITAAVLERR